MKIRIACTIIFCLLCMTAAFARIQQDEPKSHDNSAQQDQNPEAKPEGPDKQDNAKPEKQEKDDKAATQDKQQEQERDSKGKDASPASQSGNDMKGQPAQAQSKGKGGHIPDDKFRANFGKQHTFAIGRPTVVNNQTTFQYGGYSFQLVDAWPTGWAYTDDCYIDYIDGEYFLFDVLHPGVRIALFVAL